MRLKNIKQPSNRCLDQSFLLCYLKDPNNRVQQVVNIEVHIYTVELSHFSAILNLISTVIPQPLL